MYHQCPCYKLVFCPLWAKHSFEHLETVGWLLGLADLTMERPRYWACEQLNNIWLCPLAQKCN